MSLQDMPPEQLRTQEDLFSEDDLRAINNDENRYLHNSMTPIDIPQIRETRDIPFKVRQVYW